MIDLLKKLKKDEDGASAVEFALIFPVLLLMYLGTVAAFEGYRAKQAVVRASTTVVDLVTRSNEVTSSKLLQFYGVAEALVGTAADETPIVRIVSISNPVSDPDDDARVMDWSHTSDSEYPALELNDFTQVSLPTIAKGDSLIIAVVEIDHTPKFNLGIFSDHHMTEITFRRPRFALKVPSSA